MWTGPSRASRGTPRHRSRRCSSTGAVGGKVGNYKVTLKKYDDSTAAKGAWEEGQCATNANQHVATANEVAVMGTFNSGCAKLEAPVLNQAADGPMLMVSHANTNPGLTQKWDTGEPEKYFRAKARYARVVTTDNIQGPAAAQFAFQEPQGQDLCFVLDDTETYARASRTRSPSRAEKDGIKVTRPRGRSATRATPRCSTRPRRPTRTAGSSAASTTTTRHVVKDQVRCSSRTAARSSDRPRRVHRLPGLPHLNESEARP